VSSFQKIFQAF